MTRQILVGGVPIGGGAPVAIQSMLNTKTTDVSGSLEQICQLASAGCQIARLAVPNREAARSFAQICKESPLPLVADIHVDYTLAIAAAEGGAASCGEVIGGDGAGYLKIEMSVSVNKTRKKKLSRAVNDFGIIGRKIWPYSCYDLACDQNVRCNDACSGYD